VVFLGWPLQMAMWKFLWMSLAGSKWQDPALALAPATSEE
jgi:hypothetical protein